MATPVLSRLRRVLVWAKAGNASPDVSSNSDNFFIHLLVGGERETLQLDSFCPAAWYSENPNVLCWAQAAAGHRPALRGRRDISWAATKRRGHEITAQKARTFPTA